MINLWPLHIALTKLDFGIVGEKNILTLNVTVDDAVAVEMCKTAQNLSTDVSNPLHTQRVAADRFYQFRYWPRTTELHHQPQLVILAVNALADKCAIVRGNVTMMRVLQTTAKNITTGWQVAEWQENVIIIIIIISNL